MIERIHPIIADGQPHDFPLVEWGDDGVTLGISVQRDIRQVRIHNRKQLSQLVYALQYAADEAKLPDE